jgi:hypothetical protein
MSSFTRKDYQKVYDFALAMLHYFESTSSEREREAIEIMDRCEEVIGQQSDRPGWTRLKAAG